MLNRYLLNIEKSLFIRADVDEVRRGPNEERESAPDNRGRDMRYHKGMKLLENWGGWIAVVLTLPMLLYYAFGLTGVGFLGLALKWVAIISLPTAIVFAGLWLIDTIIRSTRRTD